MSFPSRSLGRVALAVLMHCGEVTDDATDAGRDGIGDVPSNPFSRFERCDRAEACSETDTSVRCASIAAPYAGSYTAPGYCIERCEAVTHPCSSDDRCVFFLAATEGVCLPSCASAPCPEGMTCAGSRGDRVCFPPPRGANDRGK